ncbi:hypothetical protein DAETH_04430 [Deinococcus aetherius]|uniref:DUF1963 domain-containing protein n=1 Tax=Deinococcus aetherius TaxID=200252 RepID=A0ABN6RC22_9DEIO|nr:YwqG family protein [Deinococcus aetherius]BDP40474.1 hypothetical protein DAETH_04430 [Deinococcus aetherius]
MTSLQGLIRHHGLTEIEGAILAAVRSAVRLSLGEPNPGPGESRIGGLPDLPAALSWPLSEGGEALTFLLQLNLRDVPHFAGNPLPGRGMLYVFLGLDEPASDVEHRLLLYTGDEGLSPRPLPDAPPANENYGDLPPHGLGTVLVPDLPRWTSRAYEALTGTLSEDGQESYEALIDDLRAGQGQGRGHVGQLFGHVTGIGHPAEEDAFMVRDVDRAWLYDYGKRATVDMTGADAWRNLLRVNSVRELDLTFWDAGYLHFLIRQGDLEARNFGETYAAIETS